MTILYITPLKSILGKLKVLLTAKNGITYDKGENSYRKCKEEWDYKALPF